MAVLYSMRSAGFYSDPAYLPVTGSLNKLKTSPIWGQALEYEVTLEVKNIRSQPWDHKTFNHVNIGRVGGLRLKWNTVFENELSSGKFSSQNILAHCIITILSITFLFLSSKRGKCPEDEILCKQAVRPGEDIQGLIFKNIKSHVSSSRAPEHMYKQRFF